MGLTSKSTGLGALQEMFEVKVESAEDLVIALAGNPNTGKSTVFNTLTGLKQHTGNWPGKTVTNAQGAYMYNDKRCIMVDLPGTYSILANSVEEEVARDFICFGNPHATVVVTDATCLERNLNLVLQIMELTHNVVVCVNLMDEAKRKDIRVDVDKLSQMLGVPVVGTSARSGKGMEELKEVVYQVACGKIKPTPKKVHYEEVLETAIEIIKPAIDQYAKNKVNSRWAALRLLDGDKTIIEAIYKYININLYENDRFLSELKLAKDILIQHNIQVEQLRDQIVSCIVRTAENIAHTVVIFENKKYNEFDRRVDRVLTSRIFGIPIMIALLGAVFWITMEGSNVPSTLLARGLFWIEERLTDVFLSLGAPTWFHGIVILGMYRTLAWVISVMLPPMAIFFPLFTLLEDLGYLPRIAFNLDHYFKKACAHGKQALTMCMVSLKL